MQPPVTGTVLGLGVDLVEVERMRVLLDRQKDQLDRLFSKSEIKYCSARKDPAPHFAARFAAKEAFLKALGGNTYRIPMGEIRVGRKQNGQPYLDLGKKAETALFDKGARRALVSLSHTRSNAMATVLLVV